MLLSPFSCTSLLDTALVSNHIPSESSFQAQITQLTSRHLFLDIIFLPWLTLPLILLVQCYRFVWQGFGSGGAIGVASVRSCEKLPPCLIKPVPAGSKTDSSLAKAKPISDSGSTSVITHLRRAKKPAVKQHSRKRSETMWKKQLCRNQGQWRKREEEVLRKPEQRVFSCSPWWRPWWGRLSPCSPWRSMVEQIYTCSPWKGPCTRACGCLKKAVIPWRARTGAGSC